MKLIIGVIVGVVIALSALFSILGWIFQTGSHLDGVRGTVRLYGQRIPDIADSSKSQLRAFLASTAPVLERGTPG